ncbi:chromophore lyase CpcT/CpeT [Spirulina sp. 06S082]|uniref:chromophore lyase CpcT/CpeT n=1 Tax=Spirulina sp. 06S082 TaxID=3110248 RepID=UPI002B1EB032|nr:chromophore lyase CpcT/CpeT [Spirulina sp. 06S082]MEA5469880.1 chromophore lyase CpcT/CpeT [Spirulina sp. 06S082]
MSHSTDILTLARWMSADFSNEEQAIENPPFFAHIRVCMRPLPVELLSGVSLLLEQAYDFMLNQPYRLRVLKLKVVDDRLGIENYKIKDQEKFYGAVRDRDRLPELTPEHLEKLPGCDFIVRWTGNSFQGTVEPGKACKVIRKDKETYLDSTFTVDAEKLISWEKGLDPQTDEQIWGAIAGAFHFQRRESFAHEVSLLV